MKVSMDKLIAGEVENAINTAVHQFGDMPPERRRSHILHLAARLTKTNGQSFEEFLGFAMEAWFESFPGEGNSGKSLQALVQHLQHERQHGRLAEQRSFHLEQRLLRLRAYIDQCLDLLNANEGKFDADRQGLEEPVRVLLVQALQKALEEDVAAISIGDLDPITLNRAVQLVTEAALERAHEVIQTHEAEGKNPVKE